MLVSWESPVTPDSDIAGSSVDRPLKLSLLTEQGYRRSSLRIYHQYCCLYSRSSATRLFTEVVTSALASPSIRVLLFIHHCRKPVSVALNSVPASIPRYSCWPPTINAQPWCCSKSNGSMSKRRPSPNGSCLTHPRRALLTRVG